MFVHLLHGLLQPTQLGYETGVVTICTTLVPYRQVLLSQRLVAQRAERLNFPAWLVPRGFVVKISCGLDHPSGLQPQLSLEVFHESSTEAGCSCCKSTTRRNTVLVSVRWSSSEDKDVCHSCPLSCSPPSAVELPTEQKSLLGRKATPYIGLHLPDTPFGQVRIEDMYAFVDVRSEGVASFVHRQVDVDCRLPIIRKTGTVQPVLAPEDNRPPNFHDTFVDVHGVSGASPQERSSP